MLEVYFSCKGAKIKSDIVKKNVSLTKLLLALVVLVTSI